jgi:hypothetical protein
VLLAGKMLGFVLGIFGGASWEGRWQRPSRDNDAGFERR